MSEQKGLIYAFTGEGKGKTSAALGVTTRALLIDKQVIWIAFYKQESWGLSESKLKNTFDNLTMIFGGKGFYFSKSANQQVSKSVGQIAGKSVRIAKVAKGKAVVVDKASEEEHKAAAQSCIQLAADSLQKHPFLLVLDEVLNAVDEGLIKEQQVLELLEMRGETHVVLTGRGIINGLQAVADLVTECKKIKHPYDAGKLAVRGLDF